MFAQRQICAAEINIIVQSKKLDKTSIRRKSLSLFVFHSIGLPPHHSTQGV
jgi:hypothetical protein